MSTEEQKPPKAIKLNLDSQDGIRGICSVVIVIGHMLNFWMPSWENPDAPFPLFGLEFLSLVTLFLVISGFVLATVYDRESPTGTAPLSTWALRKEFFLKRVARLAPVYYVSLLVALAPMVIYRTNTEIAFSVPFTLLGIQSLTIVGNHWNGPLWTVSTFAGCYLVFPFLLGFLRVKSNRWICGYMACMQLVSMFTFGLGSIVIPAEILRIFFPMRISHFAMGICAGLLAKRSVSLPVSPTVMAEICSFILFLGMVLCAVVTGISTSNWGTFMLFYEFSVPIVHCLWLLALSNPSCGGLTQKLLSTKPLRALGDISYSLYCFHFPTLNWFAWAVTAKGVSFEAVPSFTKNGVNGWFIYSSGWPIAPALLVCMLVATVAHILLEKPARQVIKKRVTTDPTTTNNNSNNNNPALVDSENAAPAPVVGTYGSTR